MDTTKLTPHAEKLLGLLRRQPGAWHNRQALAKSLGKNKLNPYNVSILGALEQRGLIEIDQVTNSTPIGFEWVYRVSGREPS